MGNLWLAVNSLSTGLLIEALWFSVPEAEVFNGCESQNNHSPYAMLNDFVGRCEGWAVGEKQAFTVR